MYKINEKDTFRISNSSICSKRMLHHTLAIEQTNEVVNRKQYNQGIRSNGISLNEQSSKVRRNNQNIDARCTDVHCGDNRNNSVHANDHCHEKEGM